MNDAVRQYIYDFCVYVEPGSTSVFLKHLEASSQLPHELAALVGVQQDPVWHPEGSAWEHTCCVVDAMGKILSREGVGGCRRSILMFAAICHDMGKAVSTRFDEKKGRWVSPGHDVAGVPIARQFLESMEIIPGNICKILPLVRCHMAHTRPGFTRKAVRKLARMLQPATIADLLLLMEADCRGRGEASTDLPLAVTEHLIPIARANGWMERPHPDDLVY